MFYAQVLHPPITWNPLLFSATAAMAQAPNIANAVASSGASDHPPDVAHSDPRSESCASSSGVYGDLPMSFEENRGQTDSHVKYLARGKGYTLFLTSRMRPYSHCGTLQAAIDEKSDVTKANLKLVRNRSATVVGGSGSL